MSKMVCDICGIKLNQKKINIAISKKDDGKGIAKKIFKDLKIYFDNDYYYICNRCYSVIVDLSDFRDDKEKIKNTKEAMKCQ